MTSHRTTTLGFALALPLSLLAAPFAPELAPEWAGAYSTLGVLYFQIGKIEKAREVLNRFKESSVGPSLDISRIEQVLDRATAPADNSKGTLTAENRQQLLQFALSLSDRTL